MQSLKEPWPPEIRERSVAAKPAVKKLHGKDKWHRYLEQNEDLRLWYESYQKNGGQTADIYLRNLMRFCINYARMTPWQYARLPLKKIETLAMKFISQMEKARNPRTGELYATEYIEKHVDAIKSWTSWNSKTIGNRKLKVAKLNPRPLASKEKLPPPEELGRLLYSATTPKRTRVVIAGTAHAGLRFMC